MPRGIGNEQMELKNAESGLTEAVRWAEAARVSRGLRDNLDHEYPGIM